VVGWATIERRTDGPPEGELTLHLVRRSLGSLRRRVSTGG
jgi:hypothetical protein